MTNEELIGLKERLLAWPATGGKGDTLEVGFVSGMMTEAAAALADLQAQVERLFCDGIHTCSDTCPRTACVLRRENAHLQAQVAGLREAGKKLSFAAQTSGGTAGRDAGLMAAIDDFAQALDQAGKDRDDG